MAAERIVLFGAGGHAKSVLGVIEAEGRWRIAGLVSDTPIDHGHTILGHPFLGGREILADLLADGINGMLVAIGDNQARAAIAREMITAGFRLTTVIHPSACLMPAASLGAGSFVHALSIVGPECRIGDNAIIQPYVSIGHESVVGAAAQFSPGVHIGGQVRIGDRCFFGPGAVVYPKARIGADVAIGANSVVHRDVPDGVVLAGNPARIVARRN
jgi:sugar O-acyltransferase (sialic acid O-acetyltransferase NeuD family)